MSRVKGQREIPIDVGPGRVSATLHGRGPTVLALGHGAGGNRQTPFLTRLAEGLADTDRRVLLFNFPYSEAGRRAPDRAPLLEATVRAVAEAARGRLGADRLVLGGKSMGGRMASNVVAAGLPADGLVFLGYPLHPPGKPEKLRDAHLPLIPSAMLFVQGTRDAFADPQRLHPVLQRLGRRAALHTVEGGDHSFRVPKRSGRSERDVEQEILAAVTAWLAKQGC